MTTQSPLFKLCIGYCSFVMTAADAAKVMDTLARADEIDSSWRSDRMVHYVTKPSGMTLERLTHEVMSAEAYEALLIAEERAIEAEEAA